MDYPYNQLRQTLKSTPAIGLGLMSGTSVDAVDAALIRFKPEGERPISLIKHNEFPIPPDLRERIIYAMHPEKSTVPLICQLNFELGELFADAALQLIKRANVSAEEIDFIGSHGQTIHHIPHLDESMQWDTPSTLQLGDPCIIAERTGITTVADFRVRDMAAGGVGAPFIPFVDAFLFAREDQDILCQNIGGIANCACIQKSGEIIAFDSGPGNMLMDLIVRRFRPDLPFDHNGQIARQGKIMKHVIDAALKHPYFQTPPPKSCGHEQFGEFFADWMIEQAPDASLEDLMATACELTALTITNAYRDFIVPHAKPNQVIISGGGTRNPFLMERLKENAPELTWHLIDEYGIPSEAKEAVGFAILAYATLNNIPANVPSVTGASHPVILGKIIPGTKPIHFFPPTKQ